MLKKPLHNRGFHLPFCNTNMLHTGMKEVPLKPRKRQGSNQYYLRKRIPLDLVESFGKTEIVLSLGTPDFKEACKKLHIEMTKLDGDFDRRRRELQQRQTTDVRKRLLSELSESERAEIVLRWLEREDKDMAAMDGLYRAGSTTAYLLI
jgi:hypothetical protein